MPAFYWVTTDRINYHFFSPLHNPVFKNKGVFFFFSSCENILTPPPPHHSSFNGISVINICENLPAQALLSAIEKIHW